MLKEGLDEKMGFLIVYFTCMGQTLLNTRDKAKNKSMVLAYRYLRNCTNKYIFTNCDKGYEEKGCVEIF